jgi:hypothetical protein
MSVFGTVILLTAGGMTQETSSSFFTRTCRTKVLKGTSLSEDHVSGEQARMAALLFNWDPFILSADMLLYTWRKRAHGLSD